MISPTISVIMSTYNHADYVTQAIDSVLGQRGVDFEFLIADDGSIDHTRDVVAAIHDEKIRFFPYEVNRGACVVTNELIKQASGEFVALINSDDYWISSDKLAYQLQIMRDKPNIGACFGRARFVDEGGSIISKSTMPHGYVFEQKNRTRGAWLRHFFDLGNCICHPTILIRKSCYDALGMYDNRLRQLPDFDMWVRLLKHYDIHICDEELIAFRHLPGENASSATPSNMRRILNESYFILQGFFDDIPREIFLDGFGDILINRDLLDDTHMDIEKSLLYLDKNRWASHIYSLIGLEKIYHLLGSASHRQILLEDFGIDDRSFHSLASAADAFEMANSMCPLSSVNGVSLINEVKRRVVLRAPPILRPTLRNILMRN